MLTRLRVLLRDVRGCLHSLFTRSREDRELDEELAFHLDMAADENVRRGMAPDEARRQARLRLGGPTQVREAVRDARGLRWLDDLTADMRYTLRTFRRAPGFTAAALLTLGLGIGATTAVFSVVHPLLLDPLPFEGGNRMARLWYADATSGMMVSPPEELAEAWRARAHSIEAIEGYGNLQYRRVGPDGPELVAGTAVSHTFLDFVGLAPVLGRMFTAEEVRDDADVVLLGHGFWKREFGGRADVVGESIELDERPHTIIGVMAARLAAFASSEIWAPNAGFDLGSGLLMARLRPGVEDSAVLRELTAIAADVPESRAWGDGWGARLVRPQDGLGRGLRDVLRVLPVAVGLVLLIASANVAHLLMARAVTRRRELAVRGALGAGRARLVRQLLTESALLAAGGGALGLLLGHLGLRAILGLRPAGLEDLDRAGLSPEVLLFCLGVTLLTVLIFGVAPAVRAGRTDPGTALKGGPAETVDRAGARIRRAMIAAEVALTVVLLVGAGLLTRGMIQLHTTDPGFRAEGLYTVRVALPEANYGSEAVRSALRDELLERLRATPGIEAATIASGAPPRYGFMRGAPESRDGSGFDDVTLISKGRVYADYFRIAGIPITEGRAFTEAEVSTNAPVVVLGESLARRLWPHGDAVGREMRFNEQGRWLTVVGVAGDIATDGLLRSGPPRLQAHTPFTEFSASRPELGILVVRASGEATAVVGQLRAILRDVAPDAPVREIASIDAQLRRTLAAPRFNATLLGIFAGLALLLSAVGLYGVLAYAVRRRTREFGIRKAVGAPSAAIARAVVAEAAGPVAVGALLGLLGALAAGRAIESLLYGFPARDPVTFGAVVAVIIATTLLAALVPTRLALKADPVVALRAE